MTREARVWLTLVLALVLAGLAAHASSTCHPHVKQDLVRYEDGSGVLYDGDQEVATYPAGTFPWDCHKDGNRVCGDVDDATVDGP